MCTDLLWIDVTVRRISMITTIETKWSDQFIIKQLLIFSACYGRWLLNRITFIEEHLQIIEKTRRRKLRNRCRFKWRVLASGAGVSVFQWYNLAVFIRTQSREKPVFRRPRWCGGLNPDDPASADHVDLVKVGCPPGKRTIIVRWCRSRRRQSSRCRQSRKSASALTRLSAAVARAVVTRTAWIGSSESRSSAMAARWR